MKSFPVALAALLNAAAAIAATVPALAAEAASGPDTVNERRPKGETSGWHLDLETDPTAFAFRGYSLHAGLGWRQLRLDVGGYAMDVPGFAETNEGFESSFRGVGAKLQLFLFDEQQGGFVGLDAGFNQLRVEETKTSAKAAQLQVSTGVNLGWRFALPWNLYATPWLGVSHSWNAPDISVGERMYHSRAVTFFPAVHLGYRFR